MTLKEIEKVIDQSVIVQEVKIDGINEFWLIEEAQEKISCKLRVKEFIAKGSVLHFYTISKVSGELVYYAKVDHIDKEKKVVKKKLDEMSDEEIKKLAKLYCKDRFNCNDCPLHAEKLSSCLTDYVSWKEAIKEYKDREFEVEVEE